MTAVFRKRFVAPQDTSMAWLNLINVFVATVDEGSFAAAGRKLNLSRSAVGKAVSKLEFDLGTALFHRSTRFQKLTVEGELLHESAQIALAQLATAASTLDARKRVAQGILRVTAPSALGRLVALPLLSLATRHPMLQLQATFTDQLLDIIDDQIDVAIRVGPLSDSTTLATKRLASMRMTLCASPMYVDRRGAPLLVADLTDHDAIVYRRGGHLVTWQFIGEAGRKISVVPNERVKFDDLYAIKEAAIAGLGIAWLPEWMTRKQFALGKLTAVLPDVRSEALPVHAVWPAKTPLSLRSRLAIDALTKELPSLVAPGGR
jgi:DNA-binding transcriptional LysR family regulator